MHTNRDAYQEIDVEMDIGGRWKGFCSFTALCHTMSYPGRCILMIDCYCKGLLLTFNQIAIVLACHSHAAVVTHFLHQTKCGAPVLLAQSNA